MMGRAVAGAVLALVMPAAAAPRMGPSRAGESRPTLPSQPSGSRDLGREVFDLVDAPSDYRGSPSRDPPPLPPDGASTLLTSTTVRSGQPLSASRS